MMYALIVFALIEGFLLGLAVGTTIEIRDLRKLKEEMERRG